MATDGTKVRFELWGVLGVMLTLGLLVSGFLWDALATGKRERIATNQQVEQRLTKLETNYIYIMSSLDKLERGNDKLERGNERLIDLLRSTGKLK